MKKYLLLILSIAALAPAFGQTYSQTSGPICSAYNYREYTFTGTPETPIAGTLSVSWLYCGPNYNGSNYGQMDLQVWVGGAWQTIVNNHPDANRGCSWVQASFTLSAETINNAVNTSGGNILIRGDIDDGCASGYGCSSYADPCFNATLTYDYAPSANFIADQVSTCIGGDVIFSNTSSGPQDSYVWSFGADAIPDTAVGAGPHIVNWTTSGAKDISLTVVGNGQTSTETKLTYVDVADAPSSVVFGTALEDWQNRTNGNSIQTQKSITDGNDNTYIGGTVLGSGTDVWLKKIDSDGTTVWETTFPISGNQSINDMVLDDTSNVYLCGSTGNDYFMMKANSDGSLAWNSAYDPSGNVDVAKALCIDPAGYLYVTGASYGANGNDATTAKFDNAGVYEYHITETDMGVSEGADIECANGQIYVFGTMNVGGFNEDWLLINYETVLGVEQWRQTINGSGFANDNGHQMVMDGTNLYLLGMSTHIGAIAGWTVARYNLSGTQSWKQDFFTGDTGFGTYDGLTVGQDGMVYLASSTNDGSKDVARILQLNSSDGSQNWMHDFSGIQDTYFRGIESADNQTIYISAVTNNNNGNHDMCIELIDTSGAQLWWAVYDGCGGTVDNSTGLNVTSQNEAVLSGYNMQAVTLKYAPLIDPAAEFTFNYDSTCVGTPVTFMDASTGSTLSYSWNFGSGASIDSIVGIGPHDVSFSSPGVKTIMLTVTNSLGDSAISHMIEVFPLPVVVASADTAMCEGGSIAILATGNGMFEWDNGLGSGSSHVVSPSVTTTYSVSLTDSIGCQSSDTVVVSVLPSPTANAGSDAFICLGDSTTLSGSGSGSLQWSHGLGTDTTVTVMPSVYTTYVLTVFDGFGCSIMDSTNVFVNDLPVVDAGVDTSICFGGNTTLSGSGNGILQWSHGLGSDPNPVVSPSEMTTYTLVVTDTNSCVNSDMVTVSVFTAPIANAGADLDICNGDTTTLNATGGLSFVWTGIGADQTQQVTPTSTTDYIVAVTDSNACADMDTVTVTVNPVYFFTETIGVCPGETYIFPDGTTWSNITAPIVYTSYLSTMQLCDSTIETTIEVLDCSCDNPVSYSISNIQPTEVTIHWTPESLAIKYKVKIRQVGSNNWTYHTVLAPDTLKTKSNLVAGTDYEYKLQSICDEDSPSGYGSFQYFTTAANPCANPDSLVIVGVNPTQSNLSWSAIVGAISYKLKYRPVGSSSWKYKTITAPLTYRNLYNLLPDTQYEYRIRTTCSAGAEPYTASAYFNTLSCEVAPNRLAYNIGGTGATVSWDAVSGAVSYKVKYRINNAASWSYKNVTAPTSSALLNGLLPSTVYQWKVKTFCNPNSNYSSYSGNNLFATTPVSGNGQRRLAESSTNANSVVSVFPNPTSGLLTVDLGDVSNATISVRNIHGQLVLRRLVQDKRNTQIKFFGNSGLYTIEVMTDKGVSEVFKVMKQ
jgi:hypothetical protein